MAVVRQSMRIPAPDVMLEADIVVPESAQGVVLFAHGSGSGRFSPRNRYVAVELNTAGLATVLADLLTADEEQVDAQTGALRFDISLLSVRVMALTDFLVGSPLTEGLGIGLFGASTGAGGALVAAAVRPASVQAVVSRGGRPDLAGEFLHLVHQPTLLIVGERDTVVVDLNQAALGRLAGETRLEIVPGAGHLFEEPGALKHVAVLTRDWFLRNLARRE